MRRTAPILAIVWSWVVFLQTIGTAQTIPPLNHAIPIDGTDLTLFVPDGWSAAHQSNLQKLLDVPEDKQASLDEDSIAEVVQTFISIDIRADSEEAASRLQEIAAESDTPAEFLTINGLQALQRTQRGPNPLPGGARLQPPAAPRRHSRSHRLQGHRRAHRRHRHRRPHRHRRRRPPRIEEFEGPPPPPEVLTITTAVRAGNRVVRLETQLPTDAPESLIALVLAIGQSVQETSPPVGLNDGIEESRFAALARRFRDIARRLPSFDVGEPSTLAASIEPSAAHPTRAIVVATGPGRAWTNAEAVDPLPDVTRPIVFGGPTSPASEPEIVVSTDGLNIVAGQQFAYATSNDGGLTFPFGGTFPNSSSGDCSLAFGQSGTFYEATINGSATSFNVSTDNGRTFVFRNNAYVCPTTGPNTCTVPDQEHIAADRINGTMTGDQVYSVWRQCGAGGCTGIYGIVCSSDGGNNWGTPNFTSSADFPRITVGSDGSVYVVYHSGNNVMVNRYASCATNNAMPPLTGFPRLVVTLNANTLNNCPVPGLDRCNSGNRLSSWTAAVDDRNANHVYVAYALNTVAANAMGAGNENVIVRDSTDGGMTWTAARNVTISSTTGQVRRYMPWACVINGTAYVSWYDRRNATAASNDLTDYFANSASLDGSGNLIGGTEFQVNPSGSADAECQAGQAVGSPNSWPFSVRAATDSTSCSQAPQLGGLCQQSPATMTDSNLPCDFNTTLCPPMESCQAQPLGGAPKYGDYNGNACAAGRLYAVWASATAPAGTPGTNNIDLYFRSVRAAGAPLAKCHDVTVATDPDVCVAASATIDDGSADPEGDPLTLSQAPPAPYQLGETFVTLTARDSNGNLDFCDGTISVEDRQNPAISCPAPVAECTSPSGATVVFNATASDNCPGVGTPMCTPPSGSVFPIGTTPFTCNVTDGSGNPSSCSSVVDVRDTTPPTILDVSANPDTSWPPNHRFVPVTVAVVVTDICTPNPACRITSIVSNEPTLGVGSGHTTPDWEITGDLTANLRAERSGTGEGRVYTLAVQCADASNNVTRSSTTVSVPHDQRP